MQNSLSDRFEVSHDPASTFALQEGRVIAVHPEQRTCDVVLKKGGVLHDVPVLANVAGTHEGSMYMPDVTPVVTNPQFTRTNDRDTYCLVGYADGNIRRPYVLGLWFPDQVETSFADKEVHKHRNGSYVAWDSDGLEIDRPDGTYIRIGASTTKLALAAQNFDSASQPFSETTGTSNTVPHIYIKHSSGLIIDVTPAGSIQITKAGGGTFALESHTHGGVTAGGASTTGPQ